jgi:uncharacterized membrane protein
MILFIVSDFLNQVHLSLVRTFFPIFYFNIEMVFFQILHDMSNGMLIKHKFVNVLLIHIFTKYILFVVPRSVHTAISSIRQY